MVPSVKASCNDSSIKLDALLKDGVLLLTLLDVIVPGKAPKPSKMSIAFKQMENIQNYLKACETAVGMQQTELFETLGTFQTLSSYEIPRIRMIGKAGMPSRAPALLLTVLRPLRRSLRGTKFASCTCTPCSTQVRQ
jgi:hypothetical protein